MIMIAGNKEMEYKCIEDMGCAISNEEIRIAENSIEAALDGPAPTLSHCSTASLTIYATPETGRSHSGCTQAEDTAYSPPTVWMTTIYVHS